MKSIKPLALLSFIFFASVLANDFSEVDNNNLELSNLDDDEDFMNFDDDDFTSDNNEDIVYTNMISNKKPTSPPPTNILNSPSMIKYPSTPVQYSCKRYRCKLNGYVPIWKAGTPDSCSKNYGLLSWSSKADCQAKYCEQVCA